MRRYLCIFFVASLVALPLQAKVVVFWQPGFPTVASQPVDRASLDKALEGLDPVFEDEASLAASETLANADLLVLPYGSSVPVEAWKSIERYLDAGGNLLVIGGQPLRVPVNLANRQYVAASPQDTYSRALGFRHTYEVPVGKDAAFHWRQGYSWLPKLEVKAQRFFAVEGRLDGLGYMTDSAGQLVAAPVIVSDHLRGDHRMLGSRIVALDFDPQPGYWQSANGIALVQQASEYARQGATSLSIETLYSAIRPGEAPVITAHLRVPREQKPGAPISGEIKLQLLSEKDVIGTVAIPVTGNGRADVDVPFLQPLPAGFYKVSAVYSEGGRAREFYQNGFLVTDRSVLASGPVLGVHGDFLTLDGKPFFPVGTNYFTTEENGWDFSGPRNAWIWEKDFAEMAAHGVSFVRTGIWMSNAKFIDANTGGVNERFLRNLEAFLDCAHRHNIAINFTFFAFSPHSGPLPATRNADKASLPSSAQQKPAITGDYAGILGPLHVKLHLKVDAAGAVTGTLDSTDQGAIGIPCADFHLDQQALTFSVPAVHGSWKGTVSADGATLTGTWDQGTPQPLNFARDTTDADAPPPNPYLDPGAVNAEQAYVRSVVERFKDVPWLSWDLINEPSFSNPRQIFKGNYPNSDPAEIAAWHKWLSQKYGNLSALSDAWRVPAGDLASFDAVPLPPSANLHYERSGDPNQIRALDYNLFAQDMFSAWVTSMVSLIRSSGSNQLIDVGQDEGGVTDRLLNQFYGGAGVSFTTDHTYWQDDALLWDSFAAKRPGVPNITGETGYQPVWSLDGSWRYDEFSGLGLIERKWALGFAAGSSGALQWDWARERDFGIERSDGSAKAWENMMRELGQFARQAAPFADALIEPDVAIILPQSFQLSVANSLGLEAQQTAVRSLYNYAHGQAYAVGEYQIQLLGSPKLILLPSPFGLTDEAWQAIEQKVQAGAVLLVTGPFGEDAHFHATGRQDSVGLPYASEPLTLRENIVHFPGGDEAIEYFGLKTTILSRAILPDGEDWAEKPVGKGKILFATLPLELNGNLQAVADVYSYALKAANIAPVYSTTLKDPGILICPTQFSKATLYVLASESNRSEVSFEDLRSGRKFSGKLASGRAALLLVGTDGKLLATYHWPNQ
jgi:hypothetical protein